MTYTEEEALEASKQYFGGDELASQVFVGKYALRNESNELLERSPTDMHHRLAREFARIEAKYPNPMSEEEIFEYLDKFSKIIPQGSPMAGIGNKYQVMSLGNCFSLASPHDSYGGIMLTDQQQAQLYKRRCGVGFTISTIRPKGTATANAAKTSDGIGVFLERFSNTCKEISQNGRRGACWMGLSVHHPEIELFINIKRNRAKVTGANLSVCLTDEFMKAVKQGTQYQQRFPVDATEPTVSRMVDARKIWNQITDAAWENAEPGLLFWDTISRMTPSDAYKEDGFQTVAVNPCQPGWATVLTQDGIRTFDQIDVGSVIWSGKQWTKVVKKVCTGIKPVYEFETQGGSFFGTENHKVVCQGIKIEARYAWCIDSCPGPDGNNGQPANLPQLIVKREYLGEEKVYDITVEADEHTYWTGGLLVSNCGEVTLSKMDSCRLLLVNLMGFISDPFTDKALFDWTQFRLAVIISQRLMDDLVDLELEHIDRILAKIEADPEPEEVKQVEKNLWQEVKSVCAKGRRTGLGITALGDALASLGIRYGSQESIEWTEKMYRQLAVDSYSTSIVLAAERGSFPVFDLQTEKEHPFIKRIVSELSPEIVDLYKKVGRRNIANTTTSPAGSVSLLAQLVPGRHQTTSGIEPAFQLSYTRRKRVYDTDSKKADFVNAAGEQWLEYNVFHPGFDLWKAVTGKTEVEESPYWKGTSADVDWKASVNLQSVAQKFIDHSISKTCNLPKDATRETVSEVYMAAYDSLCKGFTVYRDGCRDGVLVSSSPVVSKFEQRNAPKRPKELSCDIHHATVMGEKWSLFVGLMDGKPYEIIGGLAKYVCIPKRVKSGKITKINGPDNPRARYDLHYDFEQDTEEETIIKDIGRVFENPTNEAFSRTMSLALRHGTPVQYVVEQLLKGSDKDSSLQSFSKVVSRVLKKYIQDGTKSSSQKTCENPDCLNPEIVYKEGCVSCMSCGWSKCS